MTQAAKTSQDKRLYAEHRAVFCKEKQQLRKSYDDVVRSLSNFYSDLMLHGHGKGIGGIGEKPEPAGTFP